MAAESGEPIVTGLRTGATCIAKIICRAYRETIEKLLIIAITRQPYTKDG